MALVSQKSCCKVNYSDNYFQINFANMIRRSIALYIGFNYCVAYSLRMRSNFIITISKFRMKMT
jgi:hypothetical protein